MARVKVKRTNPSLEIEVDDELVLSLFTDVAACKNEIRSLGNRIDVVWRVILASMTGGFGLITALIVIL